jgi:hypothetical protein
MPRVSQPVTRKEFESHKKEVKKMIKDALNKPAKKVKSKKKP